MNKIYLIVLSTDYDRDNVVKFLDEHSDKVSFWFISLPYSIFAKSTLSAEELYTLITAKFGENLIFITELKGNFKGRLPKDNWPHIKTPNAE